MSRRQLASRLSNLELSPGEVWDWYTHQLDLINEEKDRTKNDLLNNRPYMRSRYIDLTEDGLDRLFLADRTELSNNTMLSMLAATEAGIRINIVDRVTKRGKDAILRAYLMLAREYGRESMRANLEVSILPIIRDHGTLEMKRSVSDFLGALNLRHWLAHGRYWKPKLGRNYTPVIIFDLCNGLVESLKS